MLQPKFIEMLKLNPVFSKSEIFEIENLFVKKYFQFLDNEIFKIEVAENDTQIQFIFTLSKKDFTEKYPIEVLFFKDKYLKDKSKESSLHVIDYLDTYFQEFFEEDRNVFFPLDWSSHTSQDLTFYIRGFLRKSALEKDADTLLSTQGHGDFDIQPISAES